MLVTHPHGYLLLVSTANNALLPELGKVVLTSYFHPSDAQERDTNSTESQSQQLCFGVNFRPPSAVVQNTARLHLTND